ncbi:leucyl aminopeptidase family protein [Alkalimonas sp. MEB108]|uniref:Leucyl aminopeptidase family protein n=1 Tax=Alkalimonas cellulosilytica TaxID=3058395 RepID=A0ABU7J3K6_9GAMM|nr:leucyl aminopeptidase family protein [Alkalimonas sp. MEB108]MEE2001064.1 leucyl aminopeptidase family protein [Alkalimonas sp. MEB108]
MSYPHLHALDSLQHALTDSRYDALIVLASDFNHPELAALHDIINTAGQVDQRIGQQLASLHCTRVPGQRLILAPVGSLDRDYDDVRSFADAAKQAVQLAKEMGARAPLVWVEPMNDPLYRQTAAVSYLAMCQALWQPLEGREVVGEEKLEPVHSIGLCGVSPEQAAELMAIEAGRRLARDLAGTEPERMSALNFAAYCQEAFAGTSVQVEVITDVPTLLRDYPLMMAVARSSLAVKRHHPAVIRLTYNPAGAVAQTLLLAGKGLVYDTGGADLKVGGSMAGMSRDKGGGAAVAGYMLAIAGLKPEGVKVVAEIGAVRNSIGSDAFVPDEVLTSHAGVRVRIGNTDAEGRLVLADLLSHLREMALNEVTPQIYSIATLTGHAARAVGPYTALVENGPSRALQLAAQVQHSGDIWGDPCEISRSRREDFQFIQAKSAAEDVLSCNNAASSVTVRGHQFPMAFLVEASGLAAHGQYQAKPIPYLHLDIAGSGVDGGDWIHGKPSAAPIMALLAATIGS